MKYFLNEVQRKENIHTDYIEFQRGYFDNKYWLEDSISIKEGQWVEYSLTELFCSVIEEYNYYGVTIVDQEQWNEIVKNSKSNTNWNNVITELSYWVDECFKTNRTFSIIGI